ncbi:MAG: gluconate 2-dehydrogenase subunit 3 family protein [Halobacteriaceae archaeon]
MELSRRDVLAALAAAGGGGSLAGCVAPAGDGEERGGGTLPAHATETLVAVAGVVYPSAVEGVREFVESYAAGRVAGDPGHRDGVVAAVCALDDHASAWHGDRFVDLHEGLRDPTLRTLGVDEADPNPAGRPRERVRYYLVNDLLYALYTTPTGGELAGIENPQGYPGGTASYQRGPRP